MNFFSRSGSLGVMLIALVGLMASCSAAESVTISDEAAAAATTTSRVDPVQQLDADSTNPVDVAGADSTDPVEVAGAEPTSEIEPTADATLTPARTGSAAGAESSCRFDFIDDFGDIQIELEFTSTLTAQADVTANYVVFDGTGEELTTSSTFVEDLRPGEHVRLAVDTVEDEPTDPSAQQNITCEFLDIEDFGFGDEPSRPQPDDRCRFVEVDSFGDIQIEIELSSPFDSSEELAVDYALRGPDGVRFGDGVAFVEAFDPDAQVSAPVDTLSSFPEWVSESSFSCEILAIEEF